MDEIVQNILSLAEPKSIFFVADFPAIVQEVSQEAKKLGYATFEINESNSRNYQELMDDFDQTFDFPYFGKNWDALNDSLSSFDEWLPAQGYVLFVHNPDNLFDRAYDDLVILLDILATGVSEFWSTRMKKRFVTILPYKKKYLSLLEEKVVGNQVLEKHIRIVE